MARTLVLRRLAFALISTRAGFFDDPQDAVHFNPLVVATVPAQVVHEHFLLFPVHLNDLGAVVVNLASVGVLDVHHAVSVQVVERYVSRFGDLLAGIAVGDGAAHAWAALLLAAATVVVGLVIRLVVRANRLVGEAV